MMDLLVDLVPPASELSGEVALDAEGKEVEIACDPDAPLAAFVFKTVADPFVGKLSYVKVVAGSLSADQQPINQRTASLRSWARLSLSEGKNRRMQARFLLGTSALLPSWPMR